MNVAVCAPSDAGIAADVERLRPFVVDLGTGAVGAVERDVAGQIRRQERRSAERVVGERDGAVEDEIGLALGAASVGTPAPLTVTLPPALKAPSAGTAGAIALVATPTRSAAGRPRTTRMHCHRPFGCLPVNGLNRFIRDIPVDNETILQNYDHVASTMGRAGVRHARCGNFC
jgi:hypothetical protein